MRLLVEPIDRATTVSQGGLDSSLTILLPAVVRAAALILGLCLAYPALGAPRGDSACPTMLMPPAQLREISRGFGHGHTGIDLMAPYGSPIRAAAGGVVAYAGWYFAYGKIVHIRHADGLITRYAHMSEFAPGIAAGTPVVAGEVIGQIGMTGRARGARALRGADRRTPSRSEAVSCAGTVSGHCAGAARRGAGAGLAEGSVALLDRPPPCPPRFAGEEIVSGQGNRRVVVGSAWSRGVVAGPVVQRRLPTVKQFGQLGCHSARTVWHAVQRHTGSGSAMAA